MRILCSCSTSVRSELKKIAGVCTNPTLVPLWLIVILLPAALKDSAVAENLGKGGAPVRPDEFLKGRERRRDAGQRSTAGPCSSPTRAHFGGQNRPRGPGDVSFFRVPPHPPSAEARGEKPGPQQPLWYRASPPRCPDLHGLPSPAPRPATLNGSGDAGFPQDSAPRCRHPPRPCPVSAPGLGWGALPRAPPVPSCRGSRSLTGTPPHPPRRRRRPAPEPEVPPPSPQARSWTGPCPPPAALPAANPARRAVAAVPRRGRQAALRPGAVRVACTAGAPGPPLPLAARRSGLGGGRCLRRRRRR